MKLTLSILAVLLFVLNYWICLWVYPDSSKNWDEWDKSYKLQMNIYACIIGLCFIVAKLSTTERYSLIAINVGLALSVSDIIDRLLFDINVYTYSDYYLIPIILFIILQSWQLKNKH